MQWGWENAGTQIGRANERLHVSTALKRPGGTAVSAAIAGSAWTFDGLAGEVRNTKRTRSCGWLGRGVWWWPALWGRDHPRSSLAYSFKLLGRARAPELGGKGAPWQHDRERTTAPTAGSGEPPSSSHLLPFESCALCSTWAPAASHPSVS